ncbi:MAG: LysM peptidoglycan-binding domain-containing protein [Pseudomonadota bacterium]
MQKSKQNDTDVTTSKVNVKLLDPLGKSIEGLKYQIKEGSKIISKGVTDGQGNIASFISRIGAELSLHVERFASDEMKHVKTLTPWAENFSIKLLSGKIREEVSLVNDHGEAGTYKRKTYTIKAHDTLDKIAKQFHTSAQALAALNDMKLEDKIYVGKILKLSLQPSSDNGSVQPQENKTNVVPIQTIRLDERGENGTPKVSVSLACDQTGCIKLGDTGALIEEINIRLTGFGNTISATKKWNEYTPKTEIAVKQFQRDYMGVSETGKVCGAVLIALDDFLKKHPVKLADMQCQCGKCKGFGNGYDDSTKVEMYKTKNEAYLGTEFPGIHRGLIWAFRAALFYTQVKDKNLEYSFLKVSSGYRCWNDNKLHGRKTINHMGNALDLQFKKGKEVKRCEGRDVDKLRENIFVKRLGAQMGWHSNTLALESADDGATSWVHVDVREFASEYKQDRYYATTQSSCDGDLLVEVARREGRLKLINCGGIPIKPTSMVTDRLPIASLHLSQAGLDFIKGWESFGEKPYNDSENYCTIGWGHLIGKKSCELLAKEKDDEFDGFKNGVNKEEAEKLLMTDIRLITTKAIRTLVLVPLYQHEYDALVSLAFNTGSFSKFPKLVSKLNTKDYAGCCDEFADITNGGTSGLVKRRKAEMKIFRNNVYDSTH